MNFKGKKVTVMGIGLHGGAVETIKWLLAQGAQVVATDLKDAKELVSSLEKLRGLKNLKIVTGIHRVEDFTKVDMVIKNPVVRWDNEKIKKALERKIPVEMDSSLFFKYCPSKKIIGVTGTKGKTTTSLLIAEILKKAGKRVVLVGVGQENVMGKLKEIDKETFVVFELSSWRLSALKRAKVSPFGTVIVNLFQDHLNYYDNMAEYASDKRAIFEFQKAEDFLVLNIDNFDEKLWDIELKDLKQRLAFFSEKENFAERVVFIRNDEIIFNWNGKTERLGRIEELKLKGKHNFNNILAASAVGLFLEIKAQKIWEAVKGFSGTQHRLELIKEIGGVKYYNDTTATTPESGVKGIQAFTEPINLIAGGSNKNLDLTVFAEEIAKNEKVKKVYLLEGSATFELKKMIEKFGGSEKIEGIFNSIDEAVAVGSENAVAGEVVLLSPGCASFGMFANEFDRGEKFRKAVENIKFEAKE